MTRLECDALAGARGLRTAYAQAMSATAQRTDISWMGEIFDRFERDLPVALETNSLDEWAEGVAALARYIAARHKVISKAESTN